MPNDESLDQFRLRGENTSIWLIAMLLLAGSMGAVASASLLLSSDLTSDSLTSWVIPLSRLVGNSETEQASSVAISKDTSRSIEPISELKSSKVPARSDMTTPSAALGDSLKTLSGMVTGKDNVAASNSSSSEPGVHSASSAVVSSPTDMARTVDIAALEMQDPSADAANRASSQKVVTTGGCGPQFSIYFDRDGIRPTDQDLGVKANRVNAWLSRHPNAKVIIEGHTDSYGTEEWNMVVSRRRAEVVAKILTSVGVPEPQMVLRARGEYAPLQGTAPESSKNRRVTIRITDEQACPADNNPGENP